MLSTNNPSISAKYKFYRNKITHLKESLKKTTIDQNLKTVETMSKKPGKLLMKLFLQKQKKQK